EEHDEGEQQVKSPDVLVIRRRDPAHDPRHKALRLVVAVVVDRGIDRSRAHRKFSLTSADAHCARVNAGAAARSASHSSYSSWLTSSSTIGMNAWSMPHSSAHCPRHVPISVAWNQDSLMYPGMASFLTAKSGTHHECRTSPAVISRRTF